MTSFSGMSRRTMMAAAEGNCINIVPTIRKLLKNIAEEITDDELTKLLFLVGDKLPKAQTQNMNCLQLFGVLEERRLIDTNNNDDVHYLLDLLTSIDRVDLCKKLRSFLQVNHYNNVNNDQVDAVPIRMNSSASNAFSNDKCKMCRDGEIPTHNCNLSQMGWQAYVGLRNEQLEKVTSEKEALQSRVNVLEFELQETKDELNNLICERNSALATKSELVFRESEAKHELSEIKRNMNVLKKNLTEANDKVKEGKIENEKSNGEKKKCQEEMEELRAKLEQECSEKESLKLELEAVKGKIEEEKGRVKCKRCGFFYVEANNRVDACRSHPGQYGTSRSLRRKEEWSCCRNTSKSAVGCSKKKHISIDVQVSPNHDSGQRSFSFSGSSK